MKFAQYLSRKKTPQSEPIPGSGQVPNSAGGFAWAVDNSVRLDRFLILGSEGGTYYISERQLTRDNANAILDLLAIDGVYVVNRAVEISEGGRAPKNEPAVFVLALAAAMGNDETRKAALAALPRVCRTGTHLYQFASELDELGGWGRGK